MQEHTACYAIPTFHLIFGDDTSTETIQTSVFPRRSTTLLKFSTTRYILFCPLRTLPATEQTIKFTKTFNAVHARSSFVTVTNTKIIYTAFTTCVENSPHLQQSTAIACSVVDYSPFVLLLLSITAHIHIIKKLIRLQFQTMMETTNKS
jgi:hypothetical protein